MHWLGGAFRRGCGGVWQAGRRPRALACLFLGATALVACSDERKPELGELMLAVSTDLEVPKDIDELSIEVLTYGAVQFSNAYDLGPPGLRLPATLGIVAGEDPAAPVTIRVVARRLGVARFLREIVTTVPADRVALLPVSMEWLCIDQVEETPDGEVTSTCPSGETCVAGRCTDPALDSNALSDYSPGDVFGGGNEDGGGECLDTVACFGTGRTVEVDPDDCTMATPDDAPLHRVNVGLVRPVGTDGICGPEACLVPLSANAEGGWREVEGRIQLAPAVCDRLSEGEVTAVAVTTACPSKTASVPTCGPWSTVSSTPGSFDAPAPEGTELPDDIGDGGQGGAGGAPGWGGTAGSAGGTAAEPGIGGAAGGAGGTGVAGDSGGAAGAGANAGSSGLAGSGGDGGSSGAGVAGGGGAAGAGAGGVVTGSGGAVSGSGGDANGGTGTGGVAAGSGGDGTGGNGTGGGGTGGNGTGGGGTGGGGTGGTAGATCEVSADGHYQMEDLDRGVVAVFGSSGNYVGWRMLGYEYRRDDPSSVSYNLYRDGTLVANVADSTNYWDAGAGASAAYSVSAVIDGAECEQSAATTPWAENYIRIPLSSPGDYEANDATPGDLDGDGRYEIVLKWQPYNAKDNLESGVTDNTYLEGLELDGTSLWRIDLGRNIRSGAHYTQMSVYDFDGDGRAELAVKTAPGTRDGTGAYLNMGPAANDDDGADYRNGDGYVLSGPEYLTVFDGQTGAELATVGYPVPRGNVADWGDTFGNRLDRYNSGVAMVTDSGSSATGRPSIIRQRGYYTRMTVSALNWRDGQLTTAWIFDSNDSGNGAAAGQGDHSAMAADMDGDLAQEINTGATTIGSDGTLRCTTGRGHGDAQHVGELVIGQGISVFTVYEGAGGYGVYNGNTCDPYVEVLGGDDNGRGVAEDIFPGNPGAEFWSATSSSLMSCADGSNVGTEPSSQNFLIYWDADESRELQDGASITKYGGGTLLNASGCSGNSGTRNTPCLTADLVGDWREELVVRETDNSALRVYTTTNVTARRIYTLMHDPTYRMQVSFEQSSYNQPPHTGFHIGSGMAAPPEPDIHVR